MPTKATNKGQGKVTKVSDGIVLSDGLEDAGYNEVVNIETAFGVIRGLVLNLDKDFVGIAVLGDYTKIKTGDLVKSTGDQLSVEVGDNILGQTLDPLGRVYDDPRPVTFSDVRRMPLERLAAGIIDRQNVGRPLETGIIAIDAMIPIGKGQRQLIIGDRKTGKTALCLDSIINQKNKDVVCIYVAVGQKASSVARVRELLKEKHALDYSVLVVSTSSDPAALQYLAPFTACSIAEYFCEKGKDVLIIYDDLTKHANAYRELSLLLRIPPGREAYPGDIFYLHSRLLERALQYSTEKGGGSITALPIIETQAGDVSAYIPTNVISITDGQVYIDSDLFNSGQRPAINVGASVSRVGGDAQVPAMKQVSGQLKLDLAQFRELQAFSKFGSDLDSATSAKLKKGDILYELLKQDLLNPLLQEYQIAFIYAANNGYLNEFPLKAIKEWKESFIKFLSQKGKEVLLGLNSGSKISKETENLLSKLIKDFNQEFVYE